MKRDFALTYKNQKIPPLIELRENFAMDDFGRTRAIPKFQDLLRCASHFGVQNE